MREVSPGSLLIELGVFKGASLCSLALDAARAEKGLRVLGVDWCRGGDGTGNQDPAELAGAVVGYLDKLGVSHLAAFLVAESGQAAGLIPDRAASFVFIDASHDEESVSRDISLWLPKVERGGLLAGHDYGEPGVREAVRKAFGGRARACPEAPMCWEVRV